MRVKQDRSTKIARRIFEAWLDTETGSKFLRHDDHPTGVVDLKTGRVTVRRAA